MKKLVIQTQYQENYAAHNEDYVHGVDTPHWKFKGGSTYVLPNCGDADVDAVVDAVEEYITWSNEASKEYITSAYVADWSDKVCESWETVTEFSLLTPTEGPHNLYSNVPTFMKVTDNRQDGYMRSEILEKIETWVGCLESDSGRKDYKVEFLMEDGDFAVGMQELKAWFNAKEAA